MNVASEPKKFETKLPAAVARIAAQADEAQKQFINPDPPADPNNPPQDPPADPPADPATPPAEPTEDQWKHKFLTLQGRHTAETGRLRGQLDAMQGQIQNLNNLLATVKKPPESTFQPAVPVKSRITAEEEAEYGADFIDFASRVASQEVAKATGPLLAEIAGLKQQLGGVGETLHQDARGRLFQSLDAEIPNWRELNSQQDFLDWLALQDTYTGAMRQEILNDAFEQNNFPRVAAFFKGFLAELAATANPQVIEPGNQGIKVPKIALDTIVAPGRAKSAAATPPGAPPEKPFITTSQITKFYTDVAAGKYRGRDAEYNAEQAKIFEAQNEGRIR